MRSWNAKLIRIYGLNSCSRLAWKYFCYWACFWVGTKKSSPDRVCAVLNLKVEKKSYLWAGGTDFELSAGGIVTLCRLGKQCLLKQLIVLILTLHNLSLIGLIFSVWFLLIESGGLENFLASSRLPPSEGGEGRSKRSANMCKFDTK